MKNKKMVDVRWNNFRKQREWEFAQANYSESSWLNKNFKSTDFERKTLVKSTFKDWYGNWIEFQITIGKGGKLLLHDDGRYLSWLEKNHADIFPEVKRRFFERHSMKVENKHGFILLQTECNDQALPKFLIKMQQYCLELAELVKMVIEVDQASRLKVDEESY